MNYIYDILINFNNEIYDFYEWNNEDDILHIRKIPLMKVTSKTIIDILNYQIKISEVDKIYKKTEIFQKNNVAILNYGLILTDGNYVIALKLNKEGIITGYSKLLIEEELEVLECSETMIFKEINYEILSKKEIIFRTREEMKIKEFIDKQIKIICKENDYEKIKFIYLECFNKKISNKKINIVKEIENNWDSVYLKIYNFLSNINKKVKKI